MYQFFYTKPFIDAVESFRTRDERALLDLHLCLGELATAPFGNPRLQSHRMRNAEGQTYISYVGNRGHRLIWRLANRVIVLLLFGEHDPVERRAERLRLEIDLEQDLVRVIDRDPATAEPVRYERRRQLEGVLFMAWNDEELSGFGFRPQEIAALRRLDEEGQLLDLEPHMRADAFTLAYNLLAYGHPDGQEAAAAAREAAVAAEEAPTFGLELQDEAAADSDLERAISSPGSRTEFAPIAADALATVLTKPIEDWMIFLHPDQVRLTERPFAGPARVRGAAGTGKTVVALHRARHLADTYQGKVLFTTYVTNLPPVYEELYRRLAPGDPDGVEFINLHKWAYRFLAAHGQRPNIDLGAADRAYREAWREIVTPGTVIADRGYPPSYYKEEIDWVIKGRGLRALDGYLALSRTGRGTGLREAHRRVVWKLHEAYQRNLARAGTDDFNDVLLRALTLVEEGRLGEPCVAVVIDEAQDLTEVGIRLAYALAGGDKRDGLFLVGDGQQSVYPGGYSLAQVGIDVVGRSTVLRVNYRNTRQILEAAWRVTGDQPFDDLDEDLADARREVVVTRDGPEPRFEAFSDVSEHDTALVAAIDDAATTPGVGPGDLAVLVPTNRLVGDYERAIRGLGYDTVKLQQYDGTPTDRVKVGTFQRAKGLEFKWVFLPRLEPSTLGEQRRFNEDDAAYSERIDLLRRQLFVAMTRARDQLWGGWVGEPSVLLGLIHAEETAAP
jgi:hypothetical protein